MAISEGYAGSASITTTEYSCPNAGTTLTPITVDGVYQVLLDLSDMVSGDELQIRVYEKIQASGTQRIVYQSNLVGAQSPPVFVLPSLLLLHGWDITLDCIAGTSITVDWSIRKVG